MIEIAEQEICAQPWVIVGCGFTGTRLARRLLERGATVWATRRSEGAARDVNDALGDPDRLHMQVLDLEEPPDAGHPDWLPRGAIAVHSAPPARSGPSAEKAWIARCAGAGITRVIYISATSMYPPGDGRWITEDTRPAPASDRGRARLAAETAVLDAASAAGIPAATLRAAGIYGPGRGVHARLHAGTYRIIGPGDTFVNRIHVDDLGTITLAAALIPELPGAIYNVADDRPEPSRVLGDAVAEILGVPSPPSVPSSEVKPWIAAMLGANRRVSNARVKRELGIELAYPTWREGLRQCLAEDGITPVKAIRARTGPPTGA